MNHIDEGTIHAWIDGALSSDRAREVEAHIAQCSTCSSAVAEARGLIAGASRILMALDDVPANVTPKRAPTPSPAPLKRQRQWRAAPWVTGIAAALVLAIGITTWNRDGSKMMRTEVITPATGADSVIAPTETAQSLSDRASAEAARSSQGGTASGGLAANVAPQVGEAPPAVAGPAALKRAGAPERKRQAREETSTPIRTLAGAPAPPSAIAEGKAPSVVTDTAAPRRPVTATGTSGGFAASADTTRLRSVTVSPDTTRRRSFGERAMRLESVVVTSLGANIARDSADVSLVAGCYQLVLPGERGVAKLTERVAAAAAPSSDASRRAAPAPALTRADVGESRAPSRVRLDTTQSRTGLMVRDEMTDASIGTWQRMGDSVRVILPAHGTFVVGAKNRVSCPER